MSFNSIHSSPPGIVQKCVNQRIVSNEILLTLKHSSMIAFYNARKYCSNPQPALRL